MRLKCLLLLGALLPQFEMLSTVLACAMGTALLSFSPEAAAQSAAKFDYRVLKRSACYATSPQQGRPPDAMVPAGAIVKLVPGRPTGSYRLVEIEGGKRCWIIDSSLRLIVK